MLMNEFCDVNLSLKMEVVVLVIRRGVRIVEFPGRFVWMTVTKSVSLSVCSVSERSVSGLLASS